MKQLTLVLLLLNLLMSCGGDKSPKAADFSGKVFNAAFPKTSPFLRGISATDRAKLGIDYVFSMDGTGTMRFKSGGQVQTIVYGWRVEKDSLILKFNNGEESYAIKKAGTGFELSNSKTQVFLFSSK